MIDTHLSQFASSDVPSNEEITSIMDKIVSFDKIIKSIKKQEVSG